MHLFIGADDALAVVLARGEDGGEESEDGWDTDGRSEDKPPMFVSAGREGTQLSLADSESDELTDKGEVERGGGVVRRDTPDGEEDGSIRAARASFERPHEGS